MRIVAFFLIASVLPAQAPDAEEIKRLFGLACVRSGVCSAVCVTQRSGGPPLVVAEGYAPDAVFDCASLTKVVATTSCVMKLIEEGKLALGDRAADHLPGFGANGKDVITIEQLLRHRGGLLPDNALADYLEGHDEARKRIYALGLRAQPGTQTIYTDVGFIVLGWIVEKLTGKTLDVYAKEAVFDPCGMTDTRFVRVESPRDDAFTARCIATEPASSGNPPLKGIVHDPRARALGGVAGHAGMFSTAEDLRRFGRMLLTGGLAENGRRILKEETVAMMVRPTGDRRIRGLGWRLGSADVVWHTGFTGTAMWMSGDGTVTVLLTSRLREQKGASIGLLRDLISSHTGCSPDGVITGTDVVELRGWPRALRGLRVGLITNHTGITRHRRLTIDILATSPRVKLAALFSPEHGIRGELDAKVGDDVDEKTGLKIHSLYGETRRPSAASLQGLDALVFDIQDIGTRFYTYVSTMVNCMEEAAKHGLKFVVLDRPNPIGAVHVEGPIADADALDFVGRLRVPIRHGMTVGELAEFAKRELALKVDLTVVRCQGWSRERRQDETGVPWINPSPNMRSLNEALLYPGIGILETTNISVGRGTFTPFEHVGAPWMDGDSVARALRSAGIPGIEVTSTSFTPDASKFKGQLCSGVRFRITDRDALRPVRLGLTLASILVHHHGDAWDTRRLGRLLKHRETLDGLRARKPYARIEAGWRDDLRAYMKKRVVLYPAGFGR